jgi:hypothetical protein
MIEMHYLHVHLRVRLDGPPFAKQRQCSTERAKHERNEKESLGFFCALIVIIIIIVCVYIP